jgi:membrane carboxypeptidase/penicillin-binding protein
VESYKVYNIVKQECIIYLVSTGSALTTSSLFLSAHITNGAAVVVEPQTGQILAMVGSRGWDDPDYDGKYNVTTALRQPGSSLKPVVYLTGLKKGYTAATLLMDTKTSFPGGDKPEYVPVNYDGKYRGPVLVREALGNSLNVPAVKMLALVGCCLGMMLL